MSNGKICVSVCAKTADELIEQIGRAEEFADVIEVRFDCLDSGQLSIALEILDANKPLLLTFRPRNQGGNADSDLTGRIPFWMMFATRGSLNDEKTWLDNELDLRSILQWSEGCKVVRSAHDFSGIPDDLDSLYKEMSNYDEVIKIAVHADDIADSISVWKLLEQAKSENKQIIPIAMGEAGKWTRILGLAHGAFMTYASLEPGGETAPGQISAKDLIDVYRVKELDEKTAVYGIIGGNTSYSVSPFMHNAAFKESEINSVFVPLQVKYLDQFMRRMVKSETREIELNFAGFSVTIPHKQAIIKHLDFVDETARKIGAVNTVKIEKGKFYGFNTDALGFIEPLKNALGNLKNARAAIFGAGGAARACIYALKQEGGDVSIFARDPQKARTIAEEFEIPLYELPTDNRQLTTAFDIIVNATPLGTKGVMANESILNAEQLAGVKLVYDLVYNPRETRLIHEAKKANVPTIGGIEMLIAQGAKQFEIWTGQTSPLEAMISAVKKRLQF